MSKRVIVVGGGVGGLTAAHELSERGFEVHVYEARGAFGGKARSQPVVGSGTNGRRDLPGEHGFRFYPRFYRHVIDTMERIPMVGAPGRTVADNLRSTSESAIACVDDIGHSRFLRRRASKPYQILEAIELCFQEIDVDTADVALFGLRMMQFFSSCEARRFEEYERLSWWSFLRGDQYSEKFRRMLRAVPRTMVAMDPRRGSARTIGAISVQLLLDYATTGITNDRTMAGPTSEMWIDHWEALLRDRGVVFHQGKRCTGLDFDGTRITGVRFAGAPAPVVGDHVVLSVPIDVAAGLVTPAMGAADPALEALRTSAVDDLVSWMVGCQFYLYDDVPIVAGHTFYPDSPWALTSISQAQFWRDLGPFRRTYGNGEVGGILSVDISDWDEPGIYVKKPARLCNTDEIRLEVWEQLKAALNDPHGQPTLTDDNLHSFHLDDDLLYGGPGPGPENTSRLLVHPPGSWALRPHAGTAIDNLYLAADYVRTHTDLASMEGANEAGRRAANELLAREGHDGELCGVWALAEPPELERAKQLDRWLFDNGQPHAFELVGSQHLHAVAELVRRAAEMTGFAALDDYLDQFRLTAGIDRLLRSFGVPR
jgi:uncharacterized protein with NAD-binding domain and iron-sulfur cluster